MRNVGISPSRKWKETENNKEEGYHKDNPQMNERKINIGIYKE